MTMSWLAGEAVPEIGRTECQNCSLLPCAMLTIWEREPEIWPIIGPSGIPSSRQSPSIQRSRHHTSARWCSV